MYGAIKFWEPTNILPSGQFQNTYCGYAIPGKLIVPPE